MLRRGSRSLGIVVIALAAIMAVDGAHGDQFYSNAGRADFFAQGEAVPARSAPSLVLFTRVPDVVDLSGGALFLTCSLQARDTDFNLVSKVKARYSARLVTLDPASDTYSATPLGSGKTRTGNPGTAFSIEIDPSELEAAFGAGGLAFVETRFRMTNRRAANGLTALCDIGARVDP